MPLVFIISAPSGSGKSTLVKRLIEIDDNLTFSTSVTTREPRKGDVEGESYEFITKEEFVQLRDCGKLLEWAEVFGNYYGTSQEVLVRAEQQQLDLILDIDVQGAAQLKERLPEAVTIFVLPPSRDELANRLRNRSSDSDAVRERRLKDAGQEVLNYEQYDYILINDQLDESLEQLRGIILAERCRQHRARSDIKTILKSFRDGDDTK
ncbi:MAG: guanylate kinase [Solibacterales bacterium]|nr:guanylate kinase [Bryobacterales bacterium]|tara:strand:+ start:245 stop:868 length:624 start_codon:yes stop_codon:yes gene_type:complete